MKYLAIYNGKIGDCLVFNAESIDDAVEFSTINDCHLKNGRIGVELFEIGEKVFGERIE